MASSEFEGKVALVTGAGAGVGKACAQNLGTQGVSVVVHDSRREYAQSLFTVAAGIRSRGGTAIVNTESLLAGDKIVQAAISAFKGLHILITSTELGVQAGAVATTTDEEWRCVMDSLKGGFSITKATWRVFRAQGFGRIVNVSSVEALHGVPQEALRCAAHHAQVGYTLTLAREGEKKNILVNLVLLWDLQQRGTDSLETCARLIAALVLASSTLTGRTYEAGAGQIAKLRWERSSGLLLRADEALGPGPVVKNWDKVVDFTKSEYPSGPNKFLDLLQRGRSLPPNSIDDSISFAGRAVLVTGAGSGLGRAYALHFARLGASVMVNDIADASGVVREIQSMGGKAAGVVSSAEEGEKNVKSTTEAFGRIDVVVNNAGILRDKAVHNMTEAMWDSVLAVHLQGTYRTSKAAWPHFVRQRFGRIINTTSVTGIYGAFGQANYGAAKSAIIGMTRALAREGAEHNILVSAVAPNAGTNMTKGILSDADAEAMQPDHVAPMVSALSSTVIPASASGGVYEVGSGWFGKTRWERKSVSFDGVFGSEEALSMITALDSAQPSHPSSVEEHLNLLGPGAEGLVVLENIRKAKSALSGGTEYAYTQRDLVLYAISIGAKETDLPLIYEGDRSFQALPTFGLIPFFNAKTPYRMEQMMQNYDPRCLLHVDQYLEIRAPIPVAGALHTFPKLIQVVDKGKDVIVVQGFLTVDKNDIPIFYNESTIMVRGSGGFGGERALIGRGAATEKNSPPARAPDLVVEEKTDKKQAALYRLNGDLNPLHIDPEFSAKGGFKTPILHGLCLLGIAGKHVFQTYGAYKSLKGRFLGVVLPGQTLRTEMWRENSRVVFHVVVKETGKKAIGAAAVELEQVAGVSRL